MKFSSFVILSGCISLLLMISSCAMTGDVMDMGKGIYEITGRAAPLAGGTTAATKVAYEAAQKYCLQKSPNLHAVILKNGQRDIYQWAQSAQNSNYMATGEAEIYFTCEK